MDFQPRIQPHSETGQNGLSCISVTMLKPGFRAPSSMELCMIQFGVSVVIQERAGSEEKEKVVSGAISILLDILIKVSFILGSDTLVPRVAFFG